MDYNGGQGLRPNLSTMSFFARILNILLITIGRGTVAG